MAISGGNTTFDDATFPDRTQDPVAGEHWKESDYFVNYTPGHVPSFGTNAFWDSAPSSGNSGECRIITGANYSGGGGGKGYRFNIGTGQNSGSGACVCVFDASYPEVYMRWYMRYEAGFRWTGDSITYDKVIDAEISGSRWTFGIQGGGNAWGIHLGASAQGGTETWYDTFGGGGVTSDGSWHLFEVRNKNGTTAGGGLFQAKIDGNLILDVTDPDAISSAAWRSGGTEYFYLGDNQSNVSVGGYRDYDDFAFSTTGWIGGISGGDATQTRNVIFRR